MPSRLTTLSLCLVLAVANVLVDLSFVADLRAALEARDPPLSHYTFVEDDVPARLPLLGARPAVLLSLEESVRYALAAPEAADEWLWTATAGDGGNARLGPPGRLFTTAYTHQLHCLRALRTALAAARTPEGPELAHTEHCLSFLRQHALCAADGTLEPGDAFARNVTAQRVGVVRECRDVEAFYGSMWTYWTRWIDSPFRQQRMKAT